MIVRIMTCLIQFWLTNHHLGTNYPLLLGNMSRNQFILLLEIPYTIQGLVVIALMRIYFNLFHRRLN